MTARPVFNPPPDWPNRSAGWRPPLGWTPDPSWPPAPEGWQLWIGLDVETGLHDVDGCDPVARADQPHVGRDNIEHVTRVIPEPRSRYRNPFELVELDDERVLQEVGIYRYHHPLETAVAYKDRLKHLDERIATTVRLGEAIEVSNMFTFDNSLAKGRRMTHDLGKLMLRAYNAEAENCVRSLRAGNVVTAKRRLETAVESIARLGLMMEMRISLAACAADRGDRAHCRPPDQGAGGT